MGQQQILLIILGVITAGIAAAIGIILFQDYAVDQNRDSVVADLTALAATAQQYYIKPISLGGGGRSFVGLTADAIGLGLLASTNFTDNLNGTYTIKTAGTATSIVFHGVGKTALSGGDFPSYDMLVSSQTQTETQLN